jgi:hypothetical protein
MLGEAANPFEKHIKKHNPLMKQEISKPNGSAANEQFHERHS